MPKKKTEIKSQCWKKKNLYKAKKFDIRNKEFHFETRSCQLEHISSLVNGLQKEKKLKTKKKAHHKTDLKAKKHKIIKLSLNEISYDGENFWKKKKKKKNLKTH